MLHLSPPSSRADHPNAVEKTKPSEEVAVETGVCGDNDEEEGNVDEDGMGSKKKETIPHKKPPTLPDNQRHQQQKQLSTSSTVASLSPALQEFSRSVTELLKRTPGSKMDFDKFIPNFHRYFGKQCRVADYGFPKLLDLLLAIPHVVRVLGAGNRKVLILSHR